MLLTIDAGNTNIVIGGLEGEKICFLSRIATNLRKTRDEYAIILRSILLLHGAEPAGFEGAILSSVVSPLTASLVGAVEAVTGRRPMVVGPGVKTGLNIRIEDPAQLGADLVAGAVAAIHKYDKPVIIIDMGTATTFSAVDSKCNMLGGFIYPGVQVSLDALTSQTSQLPRIGLEAPPRVIGRSTVECMQSGILYGTASMVDGMIGRMEEELGGPATVVATGGLAKAILPHCCRQIILDENLLLNGLRIIYEKNTRR